MECQKQDRDKDKNKEYIESLSQQEKKALKIAKQQLESSFCLEKSIGYLNYLQKIEFNDDDYQIKK